MKIRLKNVRLAFAEGLWTPKAFEEGQKPRFNVKLLIEPGSDNDKLVRSTIMQVMKEAWGDEAKAKIEALKPVPQKYAYRDGNDSKDLDGFAGMMALGAGAPFNAPPGRYNLKGERLTEDKGEIYGGCYVYADVDIWAQVKKFPGLRCKLLAVQFSKDGDHFSAGAVSNDKDFEDLSAGADATATGTEDEASYA